MVPANAITGDGQYIYIPPNDHMHQHPPPPQTSYPPEPAALPHSSPYGAPVGVPGAGRSRVNGMGFDGADDREDEPAASNEADGAGAGSAARENLYGERRDPRFPAEESHQAAASATDDAGRQAGFTALNN